ncbi:MAG: class I mannose-6-phosphate isomerase [Clostridia bacterium]|nr:class I mannose-6-phosphate isomerase [Clostridia bacterium]
MHQLAPVKLTPAFQDYLWGGERLKTDFNKKTDLTPLAESWELSAHKAGESTVTEGPYQGLPLTAYLEKIGKAALGTNAARFDYFPVLIKFIDAKQNLSVQVHPNDAFALENEGEYGKTEMWYVLDCEEGAALYCGFAKDVTKEEYASAIASNTLTDILNRVPVSRGDVFFIPAGTVHAIGAGIVICEIQQNSNTTYRVYDYGRRDKDGNTRPLHVEKALAVSNLEKAPAHHKTPNGDNVLLADCPYFNVRRLVLHGMRVLPVTTDTFISLTITDGQGTLIGKHGVLSFTKGDSLFIPAQNEEFTLNGEGEIIITTV